MRDSPLSESPGRATVLPPLPSSTSFGSELLRSKLLKSTENIYSALKQEELATKIHMKKRKCREEAGSGVEKGKVRNTMVETPSEMVGASFSYVGPSLYMRDFAKDRVFLGSIKHLKNFLKLDPNL